MVDYTHAEVIVMGGCLVFVTLQTQVAWKTGLLHRWRIRRIEYAKDQVRPSRFARFIVAIYFWTNTLGISLFAMVAANGSILAHVLGFIVLIVAVAKIEDKFEIDPPS